MSVSKGRPQTGTKAAEVVGAMRRPPAEPKAVGAAVSPTDSAVRAGGSLSSGAAGTGGGLPAEADAAKAD